MYLLTGLLNVLPTSPFVILLGKIGEIDMLGFLNWFIPFDVCCVMLEAWGLSMAAFLTYSMIKKHTNKIT